jgi:hypothetical protein
MSLAAQNRIKFMSVGSTEHYVLLRIKINLVWISSNKFHPSINSYSTKFSVSEGGYLLQLRSFWRTFCFVQDQGRGKLYRVDCRGIQETGTNCNWSERCEHNWPAVPTNGNHSVQNIKMLLTLNCVHRWLLFQRLTNTNYVLADCLFVIVSAKESH